MCGVVLKSLISSSSRAYIADNFGMLILSNAVAFVAGMVAIGFIMKVLKKSDNLKYFGYYRVCLALIVLILVLIA